MARLIVSVVVGAEPELITGCVTSLFASSGSHEVSVRITVNEPQLSTSGDLSALTSRFPTVSVRENDTPIGFAANHNRALADVDADYLLVANDDLVFLDDAVATSIDALERGEYAQVAALSPRLLNADGTLQRSTYGFPSVSRALLDLAGLRARIPHNRATDFVARWVGRGGGKSRFWSHDRAMDVETFRGAAMFVRRAAWIDVGSFNEIARVGGEIADWHQRCRDRAWRVVYFPGAEVTHFGSRTVARDPLLRSEYLKGYLSFFSRHRSATALVAFRVGGAAVSLVRLSLAAARRDRTDMRLWRTNLELLTGNAWKPT
jgi:GT2 family glycosyltransferase